MCASNLPSAPPGRIFVERLEYSFETDGPDRLSAVPEVSAGSVSDAGSSEQGWATRTVTPSVSSTDSFVTAWSEASN